MHRLQQAEGRSAPRMLVLIDRLRYWLRVADTVLWSLWDRAREQAQVATKAPARKAGCRTLALALAFWRIGKLWGTFPATDMVGDLAIFDIRGNNYRLIVRMVFRYKRIYIKEFLTHAEYDQGALKKWL